MFAEGRDHRFIQNFQADVSHESHGGHPLSRRAGCCSPLPKRFPIFFSAHAEQLAERESRPWPYELRLGEQVIELSLNAAEHQYIIEQEDQSRVELSVVAETPLNSRGLREMQYVQNGFDALPIRLEPGADLSAT